MASIYSAVAGQWVKTENDRPRKMCEHMAGIEGQCAPAPAAAASGCWLPAEARMGRTYPGLVTSVAACALASCPAAAEAADAATATHAVLADSGADCWTCHFVDT